MRHQGRISFPCKLDVARLACCVSLGVVWSGLVGCQPAIPDALSGENGQTIRLTTVAAILNDADLDEAEKRQALRDLGITDETLIDLLIQDQQAS